MTETNRSRLALARRIGNMEGRLGGLEGSVGELRTDVKELTATVNRARGGWLALIAVGGLAGTLGALTTKFLGAWMAFK